MSYLRAQPANGPGFYYFDYARDAGSETEQRCIVIGGLFADGKHGLYSQVWISIDYWIGEGNRDLKFRSSTAVPQG